MPIVHLTPQMTDLREQAADLLHRVFAPQGSWTTLDEAREEVDEMLVPARFVRVALEGDRLLGWVGGIPGYSGVVWELHPLVVEPDRQGAGVGTALVRDFLRQAQRRGALVATLGSDDVMGQTSLATADLFAAPWDAIRTIQNIDRHPYAFYQKMGFTITGVMPDANGRGKPDIYMSKRIQQPPDEGGGWVVRAAAHRKGTWPGGTTSDILVQPADAHLDPQTPLLRIATATIERDASYSHFPGYDRLHLPIMGNGLRLYFQAPGATTELPRFCTTTFAGDRPLRVELIDGPVTAFNLIVRRGVEVGATVIQVQGARQALLEPPWATAQARGEGLLGHRLFCCYVVEGEVLLTTPGLPSVGLESEDAYIWRVPPGAPSPLASDLAGSFVASDEEGATLVLAAMRG